MNYECLEECILIRWKILDKNLMKFLVVFDYREYW